MISKLTDRLISPELLADPVRAFRAKVVAGLGLALALSGIPAGLISLALTGANDPRAQIPFLAAAAQLLIVGMLRRASDHRPAAVAQLIVVFLAQLAFLSIDGGLHSPALMWILALPVLGAMTLGRHAGWLAGGLAAAEMVLVVLADWAGLPLGQAPSGPEGALVTGGSMLILIVVLGFASTLFESARRAALAGNAAALVQLRNTHQDLVQAHELTVEASRARRDFLARVSHELRTPVHGMLGTTKILLDLQTDAASRELASNTLSSARGLLDLLNDLLDVGRLEAGQLRLEDLEFDPRDPLEDAATLLSGAAREKGLTLLCYIGADVPTTLRGDPRRLKQVTLNLLANALRYTDEGHVILRASLVQGEGDDSLRVEVNDSGVGIDLEQTPRVTLLRPFEQAAPFSTRSHGGAGLGLAIAAQLVDLMDGRLDVESEPGVGSTFWFTVPARDHTPPPKFDTLRAFHVLVVGKNARSRSMVATLLRGWGMRVRSVPPSDTLREELSSRGPEDDLILLDRQEDDPANWRPAALRSEPSLAIVPLLVLAPAPLLRDAPSDPAEMLLSPPRQTRLRAALEGLLVRPNASAERLAAAEVTGEHRLAAIPRGDGRVLVVEDDPVNALIADRFIQRLGYSVEVATDGLSGLAAAEESAFDVILMDCQLPGMSGYQVSEAVRAGDGPNKDTPILAVTAHAVEDERERCRSAGMNDCLTKPYEPEDLGRRLFALVQEDS